MKKSPLKLGISGFGRIGRIASRIILKNNDLKLVAINSLAPVESHAYLLKHDSTYGIFDLEIKAGKNSLFAGSQKIDVFNKKSPGEIPWDRSDAQIIIDSTGKFRTQVDLSGHIKGNVKVVVLSAPAKDDMKTLVMGVNHRNFIKGVDKIISNSSCTTNCLANVVSVLHQHFNIEKAFMTTTHAVTDSQNLLDNSHRKEIRLRRSALSSIIPASTGSAKDIVKLFPELEGKISARALRVPVVSVSLINLTALISKKTTKDQINEEYKKASAGKLKGILTVSDEDLVSVDFKGDSFSAVVDINLTEVLDGRLVNLYAWYDNEWGYARRLVDLCLFIGNKSNE